MINLNVYKINDGIDLVGAYEDLYGPIPLEVKNYFREITDIWPIYSRQVAAMIIATGRTIIDEREDN